MPGKQIVSATLVTPAMVDAANAALFDERGGVLPFLTVRAMLEAALDVKAES